MTISQVLSDYGYENKNRIEYRRDNDYKMTILNSNIPTKFGIYIFTTEKKINKKSIVYIGKSGTISRDGLFCKQTIKKRLTMKQDKEKRSRFIPEKMEKEDIEILYIHWIVTFENNIRILPAKAEADLIQAYYNETGKLPPWNNSF